MQYPQLFILLAIAFICLVSSLGAARLPGSEVQALSEIAKSLGKTNWNFGVDPCSGDSGWKTPDPEGKSENNVTCNCTYENNTVCHVVGIVLKRQNLPGILPPEAAKLSFLAVLDLTRNYLNGSIPKEWGSLPLVNLSLIANRISGRIPIELTSITSLTKLELVSNRLSGPLQPEIGNMTNIKMMAISSNNFSGPLPETLARLTNLEDFRISDNQFTGKIPSFIQNWTKLIRLEIQASGLQGPIPSEISFLTQLKDVRISDLNGTDADFPPLSNMKDITNLILRSCNIIGEIPRNIGRMSLLKILDLSFNNLRGEIPNLDKGKIADIILTGNALTGLVPEWLISKGDTIDLSYNNITFRSTGEDYCQLDNANFFGTPDLGNNLTEVVPCLKSFRCPRDFYSFHINCGGREIKMDGRTTYEDDADNAGPSNFYRSNYNWAFSSTGGFIDNGNDADKYIATNTTILTMSNPELYMTARLSPLSLTYYGFCLHPGKYTVNLQFAEITFTNNKSYSSLGRRIFDVYIQGKLVLKDFNIADEAGGVAKEVIKKFPAVVTGSTLEIRFYWAGKGTTVIPTRGTYGPLVSAISVKSDFDPPKKKPSRGLVVGIVFIVVGAILIILGVLWWKGCICRRNEMIQELRGLDLQTGTFTLRQIKAATNNFNPVNKIGEGGFGPVYKGLLLDGTIIAVKQLSSRSKQGNREFVNEIGMISALQHPNLVKLYGCCMEGNQLMLVYEYLENNSLARALFGQDESQLKLDWPTRRRICIDIARALAYLHEESRLKIVHRDIKATNVLLDKDLNAKVSDFGLAKLDDDEDSHISTRIAGTMGYMAPEYATRGYLTDKADVYSFGVVALEIVSGRSNTSFRPKEECIYLLDWALDLHENGDLMELVDPRLESNYVKKEVLAMLNVVLLCTNASPTLRPKMTSVVKMLEGRTAVEKFDRNSSVGKNDMKFKTTKKHYQKLHEHSMTDSQTQSFSMSVPWTGSSTSTPDLYPVIPDSQYWENREEE